MRKLIALLIACLLWGCSSNQPLKKLYLPADDPGVLQTCLALTMAERAGEGNDAQTKNSAKSELENYMKRAGVEPSQVLEMTMILELRGKRMVILYPSMMTKYSFMK